ncbi:uncharacterized protein METZ01_LOCUS235473, partial [marine metagenome]
MQKILLVMVAVALVGCGGRKEEGVAKGADVTAEQETSNKPLITDPIVEKAIREELKKPTGELTEADLEKVTRLALIRKQLTEVPKGLEKLNQLTYLNLYDNQLTDVKGLEKLTKLKWLDLAGNKLTELPKGLEKLTQLTRLSLHDNQLTDVQELEKLTQLKYL